MTKWICKSKCCSGRCTCDILPSYVPHRCLVDTIGSGWEMVGRDCTEERSSAVFDAFAGVDNRVCHLEKKVQELIAAGQGQMKRIQELERELKNHYHDTGFPK